MQKSFLATTLVFICATASPLAASAQGAEPHGWLNTETLKTRSGDFEFKNGYPVGDTAQRLLDLQKFNRAVEVYLTQIMPVSEIALRQGMRAFGATETNTGGDLGKPDGRPDGVADRERRDGLCDKPSGPED